MEKVNAVNDLRTIVLISKTNGRYEVPRASLLRTSDYYQALVNSGMRDAHLDELTLGYLSDACLQEVREFLSKFQCNKEVIEDKPEKMKQLENVEEGLIGASYLQINGMTSLYLEYLLKHLNESLYTRFWGLAKVYAIVEMTEIIFDFALKNFKKIAKCSEIMPFDVLLHLVKSELVNSDSEFDIFKFIIDWISADYSRRPYAEKLLREVRFNMMSTTEIQKSAKLLRKRKLNFLQTRRIGNRYRSVGTLFALVRNYKEYRSYNECCSLSVYDFIRTCNNRKSVTPPVVEFNHSDGSGPPSFYSGCTLCVLNNRLYMGGGYVRSVKTFSYDLTFSKWSKLSDMNVARCKFYFGNIGEHLYAVAGSYSYKKGAVEKYIPEENRWCMLAPLPVATTDLAGCVHNGMLYVSGGINYRGIKSEKRVWQYDPTSDSWTEQPPMLERRHGHVMVNAGGVFFVVGGGLGDNLMNGEMFDFETRQWSYVIKLKFPVMQSPSILINNCLYIFAEHFTSFSSNEIFVQKIDLSKYLKDEGSSSSSSSNASRSLPPQAITADDYATNNKRKRLASDDDDDDDNLININRKKLKTDNDTANFDSSIDGSDDDRDDTDDEDDDGFVTVNEDDDNDHVFDHIFASRSDNSGDGDRGKEFSINHTINFPSKDNSVVVVDKSVVVVDKPADVIDNVISDDFSDKEDTAYDDVDDYESDKDLASAYDKYFFKVDFNVGNDDDCQVYKCKAFGEFSSICWVGIVNVPVDVCKHCQSGER
ncbi:hypothetical protein HELRODRAFT_178784 [Helobdella robusta]|uniref:BACK domain-containing protein n=1 Tax=Helobdella robusta TaxID=6412 RepID=T1FDQ6_HELRO|nr:hypothetical protein HELRODRAFT_178784 [Helobdella robusta]ESN96978.1 hypothetical protein HELRODRAFT_178784 [Helobdella robusta]